MSTVGGTTIRRPALAGRNRNPTLLSGLLARSILVQPFVMLPDFPAAGKRFCRKVIHTIHRCSQMEAGAQGYQINSGLLVRPLPVEKFQYSVFRKRCT